MFTHVTGTPSTVADSSGDRRSTGFGIRSSANACRANCAGDTVTSAGSSAASGAQNRCESIWTSNQHGCTRIRPVGCPSQTGSDLGGCGTAGVTRQGSASTGDVFLTTTFGAAGRSLYEVSAGWREVVTFVWPSLSRDHKPP